jgi:hypothetical protein
VARFLQQGGDAFAETRILTETERPVEVYAAALDTIGRSIGWELGAVWEVGPEDRRLRCACTWDPGKAAPEFEALSERLTLESGEGLPGRVLAEEQPAWIVDPPADANFPRAEAARRAGCGPPSHSPCEAHAGSSA